MNIENEILNEKYEVKTIAHKNHNKKYFIRSLINSFYRKNSTAKKVIICNKVNDNSFGYILDADEKEIWKIFYLYENEKIVVSSNEKDELTLSFILEDEKVDFNIFLLNESKLWLIGESKNILSDKQVKKIKRRVNPLKKNIDFYFQKVI